MTIHNRKTWFKGIPFVKYFNENFDTNTINKPLINSRIGQYWHTGKTKEDVDVERIWNNLADIAINAIRANSEGRVLSRLRWHWILKQDQDMLRQCVCEIVQNMVMNNQVIERLQEIGLNTPGFNLQTSNTNWLLTGDTFGIRAKNLLYNSEIRLYERVGREYFTKTPGGNIQIIGWISDKTIKEII